jgi:hypothetical protein
VVVLHSILRNANAFQMIYVNLKASHHCVTGLGSDCFKKFLLLWISRLDVLHSRIKSDSCA